MQARYKVYLGGWYQRTTLHLSEIYDLFARAHSDLPLNQDKLASLKTALSFTKVTREADYLEYVKCETAEGIKLRYYEDGLYVLSLESGNAMESVDVLKDFYDSKLSPAINYIFSLGAPTPKILANIEVTHPFVIVGKDFEKDEFGEVYSEIDSDLVKVYKTPKYLLFDIKKQNSPQILNLVETQIFFREFKDQLTKYLNIHRKLWEEVAKIKDAGSIKGADIIKNRIQMESYDRTVNLISNRINQMAAYIKTRQSIAKESKIEEHLLKIFDYKFETLTNSQGYIKEIWAMTRDFIKNVLSSLTEIENQSLNNSIRSLQIITSVGVISGLIGYFGKTEPPQISSFGVSYFAILVIISVVINYVISWAYKQIRYKIKIADTSKI